MRNIYDVMRQKELELQNLQVRFQLVQQDIETLKVAARLLTDDNDAPPIPISKSASTAAVAANR